MQQKKFCQFQMEDNYDGDDNGKIGGVSPMIKGGCMGLFGKSSGGYVCGGGCGVRS